MSYIKVIRGHNFKKKHCRKKLLGKQKKEIHRDGGNDLQTLDMRNWKEEVRDKNKWRKIASQKHNISKLVVRIYFSNKKINVK